MLWRKSVFISIESQFPFRRDSQFLFLQGKASFHFTIKPISILQRKPIFTFTEECQFSFLQKKASFYFHNMFLCKVLIHPEIRHLIFIQSFHSLFLLYISLNSCIFHFLNRIFYLYNLIFSLNLKVKKGIISDYLWGRKGFCQLRLLVIRLFFKIWSQKTQLI